MILWGYVLIWYSCGDYCGTTKARYVEVLEFTHFVTMFEFDGGGHFRGNKHFITKINCSVIFDLGWRTHKRTGTPLFYALMLRSRGKKSLAAIRTWYNIVRYYTSADLRPTRGRTISLANHAHPPEGTCQKDMV